jgi:diguanylate cyclase (GGDEF)-like protein
MAVIRDVTDQMAYEERLEHQALHDALTDLPNRTLLLDRLERAMLVAARERGTFALLLLDLDHFKEVNDTFGHQFGDLLLQQLTTRLSSSLRESDTVARLGGDEFAILLPSTDDAGAALAAGKIMGALRAPFPIQEQQIALSGSIGIVLFPQHGRDVHTLLRRADIAMYTAKRSRGGYAIYSSEEDRHSSSLLGLMGELRTALAKNQLALFFQPQVVLATQQVIGVEALIRWQHPTQGLLLPERFLLLAEQTGLIHELGRWVLAAAARTAREWEAGGLDLSIAVNLSAHNFHDPQFAAELATLLAVQPTLASRLTLEITETAVMANAARALDLLGELHDLGVRIAIDDFGTGYSSLSYLKRLPVDELKIDRAFVHDLTTNDESQFIAQSVIDLGHKLRLDIVAEGAEDEQTCELLAAMGCDRVQGYAVAAPLARDALITWLRHHRTARLLVG